MQHFSTLFTQLDQTTKTNAKVEALVEYFEKVDDQDRLWTIAIFSSRRPKRRVHTRMMRDWAAEMAHIPLWLLEECYPIVGDLAETIALVLPPPTMQHEKTLSEWMEFIQALADLSDEQKKEAITHTWKGLNTVERFIFNKLITGGFRVGISQKLITRAVALFEKENENIIAHRLMGNWTPNDTTYQELIRTDNPLDNISRPYPFYLAYALESEPDDLGDINQWQIERKWDGIRGQLIVRDNHLFVWSRGEELVTEKFPEFEPLTHLLPNGTVIDGEIMSYQDGMPLPFNVLQKRIGRKNVTKKILQTAPVILMAYDLIEHQGRDIRTEPLQARRQYLESIIKQLPDQSILLLSPIVQAHSWTEAAQARENSREHRSEGLMIKALQSTYRSGRKRGDWWKWKVDPLTIDAVMIYAQQGRGRRANLYTDYTFGVWDEGELVPFAKAYSGLTDKEFNRVTAWVRRNTLERYGPVRKVKPEHVFEIAFEDISKSSRHKSGVAVRFPRILRWRHDKKPQDANTLDDLKTLISCI